MDAKEELKNIADFVVDLLTDERGSKPEPEQSQAVDPNAELFQTDPALADALDRMGPDLGDDGPVTPGQGLRSLMQDDDDPVGQAAQVARVIRVATPTPTPAPQPVREVVHNVVRERIIREPQVTRVTQNHTNNTFVREGDNIVDNRVTTTINAQGEHVNIDLKQDIANKTVIADDGGIATGGNVANSALNSGVVQGVLAGDDVDASDAIIGDDNVDIDDSEVGAFSGRGNATNVDLDAGPRPPVRKLPEEEGPVNGKTNGKLADGERSALKEDVDLDFEDGRGPGDDAKTGAADKADEGDTEASATGAKETTDPGTKARDGAKDADDERTKTSEAADGDKTDEQATTNEQAKTSEPADGDKTDEQARTDEPTTNDEQATTNEPAKTSEPADGDEQARVEGPGTGQRGASEGERGNGEGPAKSSSTDSGRGAADPFDADGDGVLDNPERYDADGDGVLDNPELFDTDGDGLVDRPDLLDLDGDGEADLLLRPIDSFGADGDTDLDN